MRTVLHGGILVVVLPLVLTIHKTSGFLVRHHNTISSLRIPSLLTSSSYGRGAEIWPDCNEQAIQLSDSFPRGIVPSDAGEILPPPLDVKSKFGTPDKTPSIIAAGLLVCGLARPLDVMIAAGITGYLTVLYYWAKSPRSDGISPHVPSVPPQGHIPDIVVNPLGLGFTNSKEYNAWLKTGALISLFAPVLSILHYTLLSHQVEAARACARPLFLLCWQAVVESMLSRRPVVVAPLPLRILVPVAFNTVRLSPLWAWLVLPQSLGWTGRLLALVNVLYWTINLFGFLLPTAVMRYMRAYFLGVEAEQVTIRPGFENSVGLFP